AIPGSLIVHEAANGLPATLADMAAVFGARPAAVARELTKLFEEVRRGDLASLAQHYAAGPPRGEVVVVVGPPAAGEPAEGSALDRALTEALATMSLRDAVNQVAAMIGAPRRAVYLRA